jgi:hypothetical protein
VIDVDTPADAADRFLDVPERVDCMPPRLVYPAADTIFPSNILGIDFQWAGRRGHLFRVRMRAGDHRVSWFTMANHLIPDGPEFDGLKQQATLGVPIEVKVLRLDEDRGVACASPTVSVHVDRATLLGAVYYWSTGDFGIMRLAAGDTEPEPFLTPEVAPEINCPACHALSRDGTKIAFTRTTFPPFGDLSTSNVDDPTRLSYDPAGVTGYFPSFAPDNERIVATSEGRLIIRSATTGRELQRLPTPPRSLAGAPDWSWQGDRIVGTLGRGGIDNLLPDVAITGQIAQWHAMGNGWSRPDVLVPQGPEGRNDRPSYSPDGSLVAFNRVGDGPSGGNMGTPDSELFIVSSEGGQPVRLDHANGGRMKGNNWPKWAPQGDERRLWLAFSSTRRYGNRSNGRPQIWVTAIDLDADRGEDPSAPAFWMPYQDPESGNHIPYWAVFEKR